MLRLSQIVGSYHTPPCKPLSRSLSKDPAGEFDEQGNRKGRQYAAKMLRIALQQEKENSASSLRRDLAQNILNSALPENRRLRCC